MRVLRSGVSLRKAFLQKRLARLPVASQKAEGWVTVRERFDDGGFSDVMPALPMIMLQPENSSQRRIVVAKRNEAEARAWYQRARQLRSAEAERTLQATDPK